MIIIRKLWVKIGMFSLKEIIVRLSSTGYCFLGEGLHGCCRWCYCFGFLAIALLPSSVNDRLIAQRDRYVASIIISRRLHVNVFKNIIDKLCIDLWLVQKGFVLNVMVATMVLMKIIRLIMSLIMVTIITMTSWAELCWCFLFAPMVWISNCKHNSEGYDYLAMPNMNGSLVKLPFKIGYGWVITFHPFMGMWLLIHASTNNDLGLANRCW